jgi:hypothetical protein
VAVSFSTQNIKKKYPLILSRINELIGRMAAQGPDASIDVDQVPTPRLPFRPRALEFLSLWERTRARRGRAEGRAADPPPPLLPPPPRPRCA